MLGSENRAPSGQPKSAHQLRRIGNFHLHFFHGAKRALFQFLYIVGSVYEQNVLVGSWLRVYEIRWCGSCCFKQMLMDQPIFLSRKNMGPYRKVIIIAVNQLEREHGELLDDNAPAVLASLLASSDGAPFRTSAVLTPFSRHQRRSSSD